MSDTAIVDDKKRYSLNGFGEETLKLVSLQTGLKAKVGANDMLWT